MPGVTGIGFSPLKPKEVVDGGGVADDIMAVVGCHATNEKPLDLNHHNLILKLTNMKPIRDPVMGHG